MKKMTKKELQALLEEKIKEWFVDEGLPVPADIDTAPYTEVGEDVEIDDTRLERRFLEAQMYQMQYPFSEVNLGHPIELKEGKAVE